MLPPTLKSSFLLGTGENNLGFRLKRKTFVIETVHLGVEGGVGERRTEPAPEVGRMLAPADQAQGGAMGAEEVVGVEKPQEGVEKSRGPKEGEERKVRGRVRFGGEVAVEPDGVGRGHKHTHQHEEGKGRPGVRHDRMDLYDF